MAAGLPEFMASLDAGAVIAFGEGGGRQEKTPYAYFKEFLEGLGKLPLFAELATKERAADGQANFSDADGTGLTKYV